MRPPRGNAFQMLLVEIARPPGDVRHMAGEIDHMLAGAAAGLDRVAGFAGKEFLQYRPDRLMVAVERRRVEPAAGLDSPSVLAEFNDIFSHDILQAGPNLPALDRDRETVIARKSDRPQAVFGNIPTFLGCIARMRRRRVAGSPRLCFQPMAFML